MVSQGREPAALRTFDLVSGQMDIEPEKVWLRPRVIRMRALLRYAKDAPVVTIVRELNGDLEERLELLEEIEKARSIDHKVQPGAR